MPKLYIVATPIGNLEDISLRALRILGEVDFVLCEDTRVTRTLLEHYNIKTATLSYHQHSNEKEINKILDLLASGKNLAMVSDAGTPGISDPGGKLIESVIGRFGVGEPGSEVEIESVPGPSAVTAALSISGVPTDKFIFLGFPPHKKGRLTFIRKILESDYPAVVYESKHRIVKFLGELSNMAEEYNKEIDEAEKFGKKDAKVKKKVYLKSIVVCRELSKMHETVYRGDIENIINKIKDNKDDQKGEFVVIIGK